MAGVKGRARPGSAGRVVELFAGVGGFRLGLDLRLGDGLGQPVGALDEDAARRRLLRSHFEPDVLSNEDINVVVEQMDRGGWDHSPTMTCWWAGSPARTTRSRRSGARRTGSWGRRACSGGRSTVIENKQPRLVFLENVDRLLKSPASQRGRDFAIILACLSDLGYLVEWRVVNAADYGFPQRRRRVFLVAHRVGDEPEPDWSGRRMAGRRKGRSPEDLRSSTRRGGLRRPRSQAGGRPRGAHP